MDRLLGAGYLYRKSVGQRTYYSLFPMNEESGEEPV
jgi:hypothetical protein